MGAPEPRVHNSRRWSSIHFTRPRAASVDPYFSTDSPGIWFDSHMRSSLPLAALAAGLVIAGCAAPTVEQPDTATTTTETGGTWVRRLDVPDSVDKICQSILGLAEELGRTPSDSTSPIDRVREYMSGPYRDWRGFDAEGRQRIQDAFEAAESRSCG